MWAWAGFSTINETALHLFFARPSSWESEASRGKATSAKRHRCTCIEEVGGMLSRVGSQAA